MTTSGGGDPQHGAAGGSSSCRDASVTTGGAEAPTRRMYSAVEPTGPGVEHSALGGPAGPTAVLPSKVAVADAAALDAAALQELANLQQQRLLAKAGALRVERYDDSAMDELKRNIALKREKVEEHVPLNLRCLFSSSAALYLATRDRIAVIDRLLQPNPLRESCLDVGRNRERVLRTVQTLHESRFDKRAFGAVIGFPGMGKTYLFRDLLRSQDASAFAPASAASAASAAARGAVDVGVGVDDTDVDADDAAELSWWRSLPVFVVSFNGITKASPVDLELAKLDEVLPGVVRLLHCESLKLDGGPSFLTFRATVLELLKKDVLTPSTLLSLADYVLRTRKPSPLKDTAGVAGIMLVDELVQLSWVDPVLNSDAAEKCRSALCRFAASHSLMLCVSSLSKSFVDRAKTASGSVPVAIDVLELVEETRVADAVDKQLAKRRMCFQVTSKSGDRSRLTSEDVSQCLGALAGGHPRAVEVLLSAIETTRNGEAFLAKVLSLLDPTRLSLAASSIGVLCDYPVVMAVGLLGYEVAPDRPLCGALSWDHVYAEGSLTRGVLHRVSNRPSRAASAASRHGAPSGPIYSIRLNVAFLLEALARKEAAAEGNPLEGGRFLANAVEDEDIYRALLCVRAALETGDASTAWERFVLYALTAVSQARRICRGALRDLVRDGYPQPQLQKSTLLGLFPAPPTFTSNEDWLSDTLVDASRAFVDVRMFHGFDELLANQDKELPADKEKELPANKDKDLLTYVWQPDISNFPAVDGVMFFKCPSNQPKDERRGGKVVGVLLQCKHKVSVDFKKDVVKGAADAARDIKAAVGESSWDKYWKHRLVYVVLSRWQLPLETNVKWEEETAIPVIVVGESEIETTFGPGLHALVRSSPIAFGTQVVRVMTAAKADKEQVAE